MTEYTPKLKLLKKDPITDGNDTFNIKTMMNDNWDKIDDFAQVVEDKLNDVDDLEQTVNDLIEQVGNLEELDTDTKNNLIAAINEIYQKFNSHKADKMNPHGVTKTQIGLSNVDNVKQMPISGGTFTGIAKAQSNTSYTTEQLRNVILSTADASGNASNGTIWIKYKA